MLLGKNAVLESVVNARSKCGKMYNFEMYNFEKKCNYWMMWIYYHLGCNEKKWEWVMIWLLGKDIESWAAAYNSIGVVEQPIFLIIVEQKFSSAILCSILNWQRSPKYQITRLFISFHLVLQISVLLQQSVNRKKLSHHFEMVSALAFANKSRG